MNSKAYGLGVFLVAALAAVVCIATAAIVDPAGEGPDIKFLKGVKKILDQRGVDVVLGVASALPPPMRPRLASLKGFTPKKKDWGGFGKMAWSYAFEQGLAGVIFAYRPRALPPNLAKKQSDCSLSGNDTDEEGCKFVGDWLSADPEDRVFVAFTNEDFDTALQIKQSLEASGCVVFVFLKEKSAKPWAEPALVGEVFAQATHRLVVDTTTARGSKGLQFESLCCEPLLLPPYKASKLSARLARGK
jgi:hypothetical protein